MVFYGDWKWFYGDYWDLMGFNGILWWLKVILWWLMRFNGIFMVIESDSVVINGI